MAKLGVSFIVSIPQCPTVWNTNDDKILESGQNQEMWRDVSTLSKVGKSRYVEMFLYKDVSTFSKMDKIKKCGNVSI